MQNTLNKIKNAKRIIIKVGTSTLTYENGHINLRRLESLVRTISDLRHEGRDIALVSSGAVGVGMSKLGMETRPNSIKERQATSAVGQGELIGIYSKLFGEYGCDVAQILLTRDVVELDVRRTNAINTFDTLFSWGVIPIVNENDTISSDEIEFGDNDTLSAIVAELVCADVLILLSDIDGLYDKDPHRFSDAKLISQIEEVTDDLITFAGGTSSKCGTGGMATKISAAKIATDSGVCMVIANGSNSHVIYDILDGKNVGTVFKERNNTIPDLKC